MAATLTTALSGRISFTYASSIGGTTGNYPATIDLIDTLSSGVGVDAGDLLYVAKAVALGSGATTNLDVSGGVSDAFGTSFVPVKIKMMYFKNNSTTAGQTITIGGHATTALLIFGTAAHTHTVGPNGFVLIWEPSLAGKAVTASTGDVLKILNDTANAITYDIAFIGTSA